MDHDMLQCLTYRVTQTVHIGEEHFLEAVGVWSVEWSVVGLGWAVWGWAGQFGPLTILCYLC